MATFLTTINPTWLDGVTFDAQELRQLGISAVMALTGGAGPIVVRSGVRPGAGNPLQVTAAGGMNLSVAAGFATVQGTDSASQGAYTLGLSSAGTVTVSTSNPTNPRNDLVAAWVDDNGNSSSVGRVEIFPGTPAGSPVDPTLPTNALRLARVVVGAGVSSISAGNITDLRQFTVPGGGILPTTSSDTPVGPFAGLARYDTDKKELRVYDGAAYEALARRFTLTNYPYSYAPDVTLAPNTGATYINYATVSPTRPCLVVVKARAWVRWTGGTGFASMQIESPSGTLKGPVIQNEGVSTSGGGPIDVMAVWWASAGGNIPILVKNNNGAASAVNVTFSRFTSDVWTVEV